jgi:hypothetical protein
MILYGLHHSWIGLSLWCSVAGGRLIQLCSCGLYEYYGSNSMLNGFVQLGPHGTDCGSHFCLTIFNFFPNFL